MLASAVRAAVTEGVDMGTHRVAVAADGSFHFVRSSCAVSSLPSAGATFVTATADGVRKRGGARAVVINLEVETEGELIDLTCDTSP